MKNKEQIYNIKDIYKRAVIIWIVVITTKSRSHKYFEKY
jgi:hypothetical protein